MEAINMSNLTLQDIDLAVLYAMNPPGSGEEAAAVKRQATRICDELKRSPEGWRAALELFPSTSRPEVKFFALTTLQEFLGPRAGVAPRITNIDQRAQIRLALLSWLESPASPLESAEVFLRTKLAVVLALLTKADYPRVWGSAFSDVAAFLPRGPAYIDLFLRYLCAVDEEVVAFHVDRTREEAEANSLIKSALRAPSGATYEGISNSSASAAMSASNGGGGASGGGQHCQQSGGGASGADSSVCAQLIDILFQVVAAYRETAQAYLAVQALEVCQRFLSWVDVNIVVNERCLPLFCECLRSHHTELCCAACGCLQELVNKGMEDPLEKLSLLRRVEPLAMVREAHMEDEDVAAKVAQLVDSVAIQLLHCWDKIEPSLQTTADGQTPPSTTNGGDGRSGSSTTGTLQDAHTAAAVAAAMLVEVMPLLWTCLSHEQVEVAHAVIPTVGRLLATLKRQLQADSKEGSASREASIAAAAAAAGAAASRGQLSNVVMNGAGVTDGFSALNYVPQLLAILYRRMRYPSDFTFDVNDEDEGEEEMLRSDLRKAFVNVGRVCPEAELEFVCAALSALPATPGQLAWADAEAALRLLHHYSEACAGGVPGAARLLKEGAFPQMVLALHSSDVASHPHPQVLMLYYELTVRYSKVLRTNPALMAPVMEALCGPRGLLHPHRQLRARCCYFLTKLIKEMGKMGANFVRDYVDTVVPGIQTLLSRHAFGFAGGPVEPATAQQQQQQQQLQRRPSGGGGGSGSGGGSYSADGYGMAFGSAGGDRANGFGNGRAPISNGEEVGLGEDACLNLFETMGYLIGMHGVAPEKQLRYLESILTPQYAEMRRLLAVPEAARDDPEATGAALARCIAAVANVSKGFSKPQESLAPIFSQVFEAAVAALLAMPSHEAVRAKTIFLVHRMVPCLGPRVVPFTGPVAQALIQHCDGRDITEVMQMLERLVSKFGPAFSPFMDALFLPLTQKVFELMPTMAATVAPPTPAEANARAKAAALTAKRGTSAEGAAAAAAAAAATGSALEGGATAGESGEPATAPLAHEVAERLSLSRLFFGLIVTLTSTGVEGILASPTNVVRLQDVLDCLVNAIASGEDPASAKSCIIALANLVARVNDADAAAAESGARSPPGSNGDNAAATAARSCGAASMDPTVRRAIVAFVAERALPALLGHLLGPGFNPRDAVSSSVLTQAGPLIFQLRRAGGGSVTFLQVALAQLSVPEAPAAEFVAAVASARDEKALGASLKAFVTHLRAQTQR